MNINLIPLISNQNPILNRRRTILSIHICYHPIGLTWYRTVWTQLWVCAGPNFGYVIVEVIRLTTSSLNTEILLEVMVSSCNNLSLLTAWFQVWTRQRWLNQKKF